MEIADLDLQIDYYIKLLALEPHPEGGWYT